MLFVFFLLWLFFGGTLAAGFTASFCTFSGPFFGCQRFSLAPPPGGSLVATEGSYVAYKRIGMTM